MNFDTIKEKVKNKWNALPKKYQAAIGVLIIVVVILIIT